MGRSKREVKLSEEQWAEVFSIRCRSKRGQSVSREEHDLCTAAWKSDEMRYEKMDADVFDATVPFGSRARWGR